MDKVMIKRTPTIIVGHYGSGKTEFAINYALYLKEKNLWPVLADMDIVNPYFRARELRRPFLEKGIKIISSNYEEDHHLDVPALAAALTSCFKSDEVCSVIDVGGEPAGANVLARYAKSLKNREYNMWMAVNVNRPKTTKAEDVITYMDEIETASKLKINGLLNTTHLLNETSVEDIKRGEEVLKEVETKTGIKKVYTVISKEAGLRMKGEPFAENAFYIEPMIKPYWL